MKFIKGYLLGIVLLVLLSSVSLAGTDDSAINWYPFDNSTYDVVNQTTATTVNNVPFEPGYVNYSVNWNESNQSSMYHKIDRSLSDFSVSFWVDITDTSTGTILGITNHTWEESSFFSDYNLGLNRFRAINKYCDHTLTLNGITGWIHLVYTFDADTNTSRLYNNGTLVSSETKVGGCALSAPYNFSYSFAGAQLDNGVTKSFSEHYGDRVDEFAIFNKTLTGDEVGFLYNHGLGVGYPFNEVTLRREADNSLFNVTRHDSVGVFFHCDDTAKSVEEYNFTFSQQALRTNCTDIDFVRVTVDLNDTDYYRGLIRDAGQDNYTLYLIDLTLDSAVEIDIILDDKTSSYNNGYLRASRFVGGANRPIIEQYFDVESKVVLFLLNNQIYDLSIFDNDGVERVLGDLIADQAGVKVVRVDSIEFYPSTYLLGDDIYYSINPPEDGIIRVSYTDKTNNTNNVTVKIYDGEDALVFSEVSTASSVVFTFAGVEDDESYLVELTIDHPDLSEDTVSQLFTPVVDFFAALIESFGKDLVTQIKMWSSLVFLVILGLSFSPVNIGAGFVVIAFFGWLFVLMGFLAIGTLVLGIITTMAIIAWYAESDAR